jgi:hypothetical protein
MNTDLQQLLTVLFPCVQHYTKHGVQTHYLTINEISTVYFWNHMPHITVNEYLASGCGSFRVLENEHRAAPVTGVVQYDVRGQRGFKPTPGLLRGYT